MIGILCALDIELRHLQERLTQAGTQRVMGFDVHVGNLEGQKVALVQCGVGKVNAALCCQTLLMRYEPTLIINSGVAGSLNRELEILDVAVARDVVKHDVDTTALGDPPGMVSTVNVTYFPCDPVVSQGILSVVASMPNLRGKAARIATGEQFVTSAQRKREIVDLFHADACDMEAGAIAQACYIAGVPCAVIRAISDATDDSHQMEYPAFAAKAADHAASVLTRYLSTL